MANQRANPAQRIFLISNLVWKKCMQTSNLKYSQNLKIPTVLYIEIDKLLYIVYILRKQNIHPAVPMDSTTRKKTSHEGKWERKMWNIVGEKRLLWNKCNTGDYGLLNNHGGEGCMKPQVRVCFWSLKILMASFLKLSWIGGLDF